MRQLREVNILAILVVIAATVLAVMDKVDPDAVLFLLTGLAIPAKNTGYSDTAAAPIVATPTGETPPAPYEGI